MKLTVPLNRGANQDTVELLPQGDKISKGWRLSLKLGSSPWECLTESVSCIKRLLWFFLHEFSEIRALRICFSFSSTESHFLISAGSMWKGSITTVNLKSRKHSSGQEDYILLLINSSRELSQIREPCEFRLSTQWLDPVSSDPNYTIINFIKNSSFSKDIYRQDWQNLGPAKVI